MDGELIPGRCPVEVTFRTHQERFLLRPDVEANEIILGCLGRAYYRYPELRLNVLSILSDHGCFVAHPESSLVLSCFMRDFLADCARRLNRHRDREGTFWERRYRCIPIVDEAKLEDRFRYVLTQGTKENLVWSARDWPGVNSAHALMGGPQLVGRWRDRTAEGELIRQRARKIERAEARGRVLELPKAPQVWREYPIELVPMPHWEHLKVGQRRARVAELLRQDDEKTRERHAREGTRPLGVAAILATSPTDRPANPAKSPAPLCHASTPSRRRAFRTVYRAYLDAQAELKRRAQGWLRGSDAPPHIVLPPLDTHPALSARRPHPPPVQGDPPLPTGPPAVG